MPHPKGGYRLNGKKVPGVTTIIGRFDDKEGLIEWAFRCGASGKDYKKEGRRAADAGSAAHDAIESYLQNNPPDWDLITKERQLDAEQVQWAKNCASGFYAWRAKYKPTLIAAEEPLIHSEYEYGGCIDAICKIGDGVDLVDWKTSKHIHKGYFIQAAAYVKLWEKERADEVLSGATIVRMDKLTCDYEVYRLPRHELDALFEEFLMMKDLYDMKVKNRTIRYEPLKKA